MIDTKYRKVAQPSFNYLAKALIKMKVKADTITILAFITGILASIFIAKGFVWMSIALLWLSGLFDVLDGTVARLSNMSTQVGAYMDLIFDRMVESSVILGFYYLFPEYALAYLLFFVAVLFNFTTFIIAGALFSNKGKKSMHYDIGIAERTETFIAFTLMIVFSQYLALILMIFNAIVFVTGIIRFIRIVKNNN